MARKEKGLSFDKPLIILARPAGFEPTTPWFVAKYSIHLSYGRIKQNYSNYNAKNQLKRPQRHSRCCLRTMARPTGLEPVTPGLEGRCSIQMSYGRESNARRTFLLSGPQTKLVGVIGFEPTTSWSQTRRATGLRYAPTE